MRRSPLDIKAGNSNHECDDGAMIESCKEKKFHSWFYVPSKGTYFECLCCMIASYISSEKIVN